MPYEPVQTAAPLVPEKLSLPRLRAVAAGCTACPLYKTGTQTVFGKSFKVTQMRGEILQHELAEKIMATVHPSSILRAPDDETRHREMELFVRDLRRIAPLVQH